MPVVTGWWEEVHAAARLSLSPELASTVSRRVDLLLALSPAMSASPFARAGVSFATAAVSVAPAFGSAAVGTSRAGAGLSLSPTLAAGAGERYARAVEFAAAAVGMGVVGAEHYVAAAGLLLVVQLGADAARRALLSLSPELSAEGAGIGGVSAGSVELVVTPAFGAENMAVSAAAGAQFLVTPALAVNAMTQQVVRVSDVALKLFPATALTYTMADNSYDAFAYTGARDSVVMTGITVERPSGPSSTLQMLVEVEGQHYGTLTDVQVIPAQAGVYEFTLERPVILPKNSTCRITYLTTSFNVNGVQNANLGTGFQIRTGSGSVGVRSNPRFLEATLTRSFSSGLAVTPALGASQGEGVATAAAGLAVTPVMSSAGVERYARAAEMAAPPALGPVGAEHYARTAGLEVVPSLGSVVASTSGDSAELTVIPAVVAVGAEHYARAVDLTVMLQLGPFGVDAESEGPSPYPSEFDYPSETDYPFDP